MGGLEFKIYELLEVYGKPVKKLPVLGIILGVYGALVAVVIIYLWKRRCNQKQRDQETTSDDGEGVEPADNVPMLQVDTAAMEQTVHHTNENRLAIPSDKEISKLSSPSYQDSASVHSEDQVPSYEEVMGHSYTNI
jgi:hypothetical protein